MFDVICKRKLKLNYRKLTMSSNKKLLYEGKRFCELVLAVWGVITGGTTGGIIGGVNCAI